jgi:S-adenosylmethionine synthetase
VSFPLDASPRERLFTSESVSEGHPDKVADRISDAVLDWLLTRDPAARVACETLIAKDLIVVAGEFGSSRIPNLLEALHAAIPEIARGAVRAIGYGADSGFDPDRCEVKLSLSAQSADIAQGVDRAAGEVGAGDQGLVFGHACDETPELMLLPISLAHALMRRQAMLRREGALPWLRPDAKSQVTVRYAGDRPTAVEKVVLSTQHAPGVDRCTLDAAVIREIIEPVIPRHLRAPQIQYLVNPTGRFEIGGPAGDTGLTGRKIIVDTYGGRCAHGGGAFSGKDPTKVDRSAAYAARQLAKTVVAAGLARRCTVQVAYAIGVAEPVSIALETHGTGLAPDEAIEAATRSLFDLRPAAIIERLRLRRPIFEPTSAYGHFGRRGFAWEDTAPFAAPLRAAIEARLGIALPTDDLRERLAHRVAELDEPRFADPARVRRIALALARRAHEITGVAPYPAVSPLLDLVERHIDGHLDWSEVQAARERAKNFLAASAIFTAKGFRSARVCHLASRAIADTVSAAYLVEQFLRLASGRADGTAGERASPIA